MLNLLRSIVFNALFYLNTLVWLLLGLPTFFMPYRATIWVAKSWGRINLVLLRVVAGIDCELRGREKIPPGPLIVASKHQSAWETFALLPLFDNPLFIVKRELMWIPIFGWLMRKGRMVPVDRGAGSQALAAMAERARTELGEGRQLIIFPEGTRRPAGAEPRYKYGVAHLYVAEGVPCLPVALNSGLFWPRRSLKLRPGTVIVEILDPIAPGLDKDAFFERLRNDIETATARLLAEGRNTLAAFVRALEALREQVQLLVAEALAFDLLHRVEYVVAIDAGMAVPLSHEMQLPIQRQAAGILRVAAVDHVAERLHALLRVVVEPDGPRDFAIDHGGLLAFAQIAKRLGAHAGRHAVGNAAAIAAAVEAEHQSGFFRRAAVHEGVDTERAVGADQAGGAAIEIGKVGPPHQRAIGKNPQVVTGLVGCWFHRR